MLSSDLTAIIAYGQTSSGKRFTMQGVAYDPEYEGVIQRIIKYIFSKVKRQNLMR